MATSDGVTGRRRYILRRLRWMVERSRFLGTEWCGCPVYARSESRGPCARRRTEWARLTAVHGPKCPGRELERLTMPLSTRIDRPPLSLPGNLKWETTQ